MHDGEKKEEVIFAKKYAFFTGWEAVNLTERKPSVNGPQLSSLFCCRGIFNPTAVKRMRLHFDIWH